MTLFVEDLFTFLSNQGTDAASRIYPGELPQGVTLPAIRYLLVSDPPEHTHDGPSSLRHPRYQLDCFAERYLQACTLAHQVMTVLDGYRGAMGDATCHAGFADNLMDHHDPETGRHWVSVDFIIWYSK